MGTDEINITAAKITGAAAQAYVLDFGKQLSKLIRRAHGEVDEAEMELLRRCHVRAKGTLPAHQKLVADAAVAVLADLAKQGWSIRVRGRAVFGRRPRTDGTAVREQRRTHLAARRNEQLRETATRDFIASMERGHLHRGKRVSAFSLMRDGRDLVAALGRLSMEPSVDQVRTVVEPYLQIVGRGSVCEETGFQLTDIWRYFRHTWSNPYESIPGRTLQVMVRDAAAPYHPVIGIAALSSAASVLPARDSKFIGWTADALLSEIPTWPAPRRRQLAAWIFKFVDDAVRQIYRVDFIEDGMFPSRIPSLVSDELLQSLRKDADRARKAHDAETRNKAYVPPKGHGALEDEYWERQARTSLFRGKRALELASLLSVRNVVSAAYRGKRGGARLDALLATDAGRNVFGKIIRKARSESIGSAIADLTVCGGIAPYSELTAGKLVALLCVSPQLVAAYKKRYEGSASVIASSMAGRRLVRRADLVFVGTTSLYGVRPNQYDRAVMPAAMLDGNSRQALGYRFLGDTGGYGSSQFGEATKMALERVVEMQNNGRTINNIFGEGASPRMRALREGIAALGMPEDLLRHAQIKSVYGATLVDRANLRDYLLGISKRPKYIVPPRRTLQSTQQIADWWFRRWALPRVRRPEIIERIAAQTLIHPISHSARVVLPDADLDQLKLFSGV